MNYTNLLHLRLALGRSLHGVAELDILILLLHFRIDLLNEGSPLGDLARSLL